MAVCVSLPFPTDDVETLIERLKTFKGVSVKLLDGKIKLSGDTTVLNKAQNYCLKFIGPEAVLLQSVSPNCFNLLQAPCIIRHFEEFFNVIVHSKSPCVILLKGSKENIDCMHPYLLNLDEYSRTSCGVLSELKLSCLESLCKKYYLSLGELPQQTSVRLALLFYLSSIVGATPPTTESKTAIHFLEAYRRKTPESPGPGRKQDDCDSQCRPPSDFDLADLSTVSVANGDSALPVASSPASRHLRSIIIDGSNVAFAHGNQNRFSPDGILLAVNFFLKRGHTKVVAVVPRFRQKHAISMFEKLERRGHLTYTPSRFVNDTQQIADDDRFILRLALENDAVIVSNDQFRNHRDKNGEFTDLIDKRLLQYTMALDTFLVADDPLGRDGPSLSDFLSYAERST